jgi:prepilin-type N-terminal cleavage/methylation domain-containing protein
VKRKFVFNNFFGSCGRKSPGFTLVELLAVIAIIGILTGIIMVNIGGLRAKARDARRKADLSQIQNALELYYAEHDLYPVVEIWSGVCPWFGSHSTSGADAYIPGLSNILPALPTDPSGCL